MGRLFGTDGIRGLANQEPITPETALRLGRAAVEYCTKKGEAPVIVIARDPRSTGEMLEHGILAGVISAGGTALVSGVIPTPGLAFLARETEAALGIMISASHNPHNYNGFKVFSGEGFKLSEREEYEFEEILLSPGDAAPPGLPGSARTIPDPEARYRAFLRRRAGRGVSLRGMKAVLDCANGAASRVAPALLRELEVDTDTLFDKPDGRNINSGCGSEHTENLSGRVREAGAQVGLAFDGDADRLVAVDERGRRLSGDQLLTIFAKELKEQGKLVNNCVVSTVMSNIGLKAALSDMGIRWVSAPVGDRNVLAAMRENGAVLGGEDSGHMIFLDRHTTGDGLLSALMLLEAMKNFDRPLSELAGLMQGFPQALVNVPVREKPELEGIPDVKRVIEQVEGKLGERGRVLVRYSGTEPLCRVMVEGGSREEVDAAARKIAEAVKKALDR